MGIFEFSKIKGYLNFIKGSHLILIHTLVDFFSAEVKLEFNPIRKFKNVGECDIEGNINRNVYIISKDSILLLCKVQHEDNYFVLGISLKAKKIGETNNGKIYNIVASTVSKALQEASKSFYRSSINLFGEGLIVSAIAKYASQSLHNVSKVHFLIGYFNALRSTTFEGKYFSTGLIVTGSLFDYKERTVDGSVMYLNAVRQFTDCIDARYWYLVDGHSVYYLSDARSEIHYMYICDSQNRINQGLLSRLLHHRDILFRTNNGRELSVIVSNGIVFIYQENVWRYRNYQWIKNLIREEISLDENVYNAILYYVLYCSRNDTSSIIWIPKNVNSIKDFLKTSHAVSRKSFSILNPQFDGLIKRLMASDGATVICPDGTVKYYGCIIKMEVADNKTLKGTGETAASRLASNGIAIKISQDGTIKIFLNERTKIKF